jgi:hypothetical protein
MVDMARVRALDPMALRQADGWRAQPVGRNCATRRAAITRTGSAAIVAARLPGLNPIRRPQRYT